MGSATMYVLGVDGGGTKVDGLLLASTGEVLGYGQGGSASEAFETHDAVAASVDRMLEETFRGVEIPQVDRVLVAGSGRIARGMLQREFGAERYQRVGDTHMIMASNRLETGIIVLAGTGSFVFGRNRRGEERYMGGAGPVIGDEGSAYDIGVMAIRASYRATDGPHRATTLAQRVPEALYADNIWDVIGLVHRDHLSRASIAALSKVVDEEAERGDEVAIQILRKAADHLVELFRDLVDAMDMVREPYDIAPAGSVATNSRTFWRSFLVKARRKAPLLRPMMPKFKPVVGAALLAMQKLGVEMGPEFFRCLEESYSRKVLHRNNSRRGYEGGAPQMRVA